MVLEDHLIKKGLFIKKNGAKQSMEIKKPLKINYEAIEDITKEIGLAIHQDISQKSYKIKSILVLPFCFHIIIHYIALIPINENLHREKVLHRYFLCIIRK